ncbi:MAG: PIN domain-containing protein, partial [Nitrososphaera sp.]
YKFVIDSYAWIEYFRGTESGGIAKNYIESKEAATSVISVSELKEKYLREGWDYFSSDLLFLTSVTTIVSVDKELATSAGQINFERKKMVKDWGMSDSIVLATAEKVSAKVVTGDAHFSDLKEAIMIK